MPVFALSHTTKKQKAQYKAHEKKKMLFQTDMLFFYDRTFTESGIFSYIFRHVD